jgi:formylglycine-generating enzyme required for sulfatase activity
MSYCPNADCQQPQNPANTKFCQSCGTKLLLRERYRAIKTIGQGGFGKNYLAVDEDKPSKPTCVIKQFHPQHQETGNLGKAAELFNQEAVRLDELGVHPQIPKLLAYFTEDNHQYLVQEFIEGQNLAEILKTEGVFNEAKIWDLLKNLLPVLEFIHSHHIIHRDIKPDNIIQTSDRQLVLVDFGAAKYATGSALIKTGTVIGTAEYIAPEQIRGKAVFASDLYSLGVTCIHLLTQVSPFQLFDVAEDTWVWRQFLVDNLVSNELGEILDKLIANATKRRYQSASEVMKILDRQPKSSFKSPSFQSSDREVSLSQVYALKEQPKEENSRLRLRPFQFEVVVLDRRGRAIDQYHRQAKFFAEDLGNRIALEMVAIPGGTFIMGSPDDEQQRDEDEGPQHQVTVAPFFMGKYPMTQEQWEAVMGKNPSYFKGKKRPVENVSWHEANEFCQQLLQKTGKKYRLPSEAEWEYACRAGTTTPFHFGETITTDVANYKGNDTYASAPKGVDREQTTDVGSFPPNRFGLYDMHGNVWEWCADASHDSYRGAPSDGSVWLSSGDNRFRLLRGGSWCYEPWICRCANRFRINPRSHYDFSSLRVVLDYL